jgi:NitT/TauT family transport system substrate-binding protein
MKPYVTPPNAGPIGYLEEERVTKSIAAIQAAGLMPSGLTPDKVVDFSFIKKS